MPILQMQRLRVAKDWTLSYVGEVMNKAKSTVCDWEHGRCRPSYDDLKKLSTLYNTDIDHLLQQVDDTPCSSV